MGGLAHGSAYGQLKSKDGRIVEYSLMRGNGSGGNIVAISGAGMNIDIWQKQKPLAERHSMLIYRGNGFDSENAGIVLDLCRRFALVTPHLVGHSMGTKTCMEYCRLTSKEPGYIPASLTLITPVEHEWDAVGFFTRLMILVQRTGIREHDENLVSFIRGRSKLPAKARLELCESHYPFHNEPKKFNRLLLELISSCSPERGGISDGQGY